MKVWIFSLMLIGFILSGCRSMTAADMYASDAMYGGAPAAEMSPAGEEVQSDRMLIWTGSLTLEVISLTNAAQSITALTKEMGGYVESSSQHNYHTYRPSITLKLRVPSTRLDAALNGLEGIGDVISKSLSSDDVTERYVDTQARLNTKKQLRDRLQKLLDKADDVKDVLAIEKELTRLQADIDSMEALLRSMKGKVDFAKLTVELQPVKQEQVLGPVGYVWEGAVWCVKKLFIWKDESYVEQ